MTRILMRWCFAAFVLILIIGCTDIQSSLQEPIPENTALDREVIVARTSQVFQNAQHEIDTWYEKGGRNIGPDHYERLRGMLEEAARQGAPEADVSIYMQKLESIVVAQEPDSPARDEHARSRSDEIKKENKPIFRKNSEIPTNEEMERLPDCSGLSFSQFPVDMTSVYEISPRGSIGPPGHTFPTEHSFIHIGAGGVSTKTIPLFAPADVYVTSVTSQEGATNDPVDYTIYFALCKDIFGYYNHVKELSDQMTLVLAPIPCENFTTKNEKSCTKNLLQQFNAGAWMGRVGGLQGNFDFGLFDLRKPLNFVNAKRYPTRNQYIGCAYDYYLPNMKDSFFALIKGGTQDKCGVIMQDISGTLQGNWFHESADEEYVTRWETFLAFVYDNSNSGLAVVSIGGMFSEAAKFEFVPMRMGVVNRRFDEITADGSVYCFEDTSPSAGGKRDEGRVLVQMIRGDELKIERQSEGCAGISSFKSAQVYRR